MSNKIVCSHRFSTSSGVLYEFSLVHVDPKGEYGGFLSLEMNICDRTDTCMSSTVRINTLFDEDLDEMIAALTDIKQELIKRNAAINALVQSKKALGAI